MRCAHRQFVHVYHPRETCATLSTNTWRRRQPSRPQHVPRSTPPPCFVRSYISVPSCRRRAKTAARARSPCRPQRVFASTLPACTLRSYSLATCCRSCPNTTGCGRLPCRPQQCCMQYAAGLITTKLYHASLEQESSEQRLPQTLTLPDSAC